MAPGEPANSSMTSTSHYNRSSQKSNVVLILVSWRLTWGNDANASFCIDIDGDSLLCSLGHILETRTIDVTVEISEKYLERVKFNSYADARAHSCVPLKSCYNMHRP